VAKTLCDWSEKDIEKKAAKLAELLLSPRFLCRRCARAAARSKVLCKPARLESVTGCERDKTMDPGWRG
jgi:hypothetical protein